MNVAVLSRRAFLRTSAVAVATPALASLPVMPADAGSFESATTLTDVAANPVINPYRWWVSFDEGELFTADFGTVEEARAYAANSGGGLIAECRHADPYWDLVANTLAEAFAGQNEDLSHPDFDDAFCDVGNDDWRDLADRIAPVIDAWRRERSIDDKLNITMFGQTRNRETVPPSLPETLVVAPAEVLA